MQRFQGQKTKLFYFILATASIFAVFLAVAAYTVLSTLWLYGQAISSNQAVLCGCEVTLSFTEHPYLMTGLLVGGSLLLGFLVVSMTRAMLLVTKTNFFVYRRISNRLPIANTVFALMQRHGLEQKVIVFNSDFFEVFCFGVWQPRIAISQKVIDQLSWHELEAVLLHEKTHLEEREPGKLLILKMVGYFSVLVPGVRRLMTRYFTLTELAADQAVVRLQQTTQHLSRALAKLMGAQQLQLSAVSHFNAITDYRVEFLTKGAVYVPSVKREILILLSIILVSVVGGVSVYSSAQAAEPNLCQGQVLQPRSYQCQLIELPTCASTADPMSALCG